MLHILWLAVKFIGMLLALILAFLLVAAVLVLFCPLRYRVRIRKTVDEWEAWGRISWLFGLIRVTLQRGSAGSDMQIRIFGIRPGALKKLLAGKKRSDKKLEKQPKKEPKDKPSEEDRQPPAARPEASQTEAEPLPFEELETAEEKTPVSAEAAGEEQEKEHTAHPKESFWKHNPVRKLWVRIAKTVKRIRESLINFQNTVKNICSKISIWKEFLSDSHTGEAFRLTRQQLFRLLRHAGPRKWEGTLNFGLEDPAATGQVLAVLGALYPIHRGKFLVNPIWDRKVLEGNARVKGRVYGVMLLYTAGRLFFDKNVKDVIRRFRQQSDSGWNVSSGM